MVSFISPQVTMWLTLWSMPLSDGVSSAMLQWYFSATLSRLSVSFTWFV